MNCMRRLVLVFALTLPVIAQDSPLFPRFSITGASAAADFETNARIDPDEATGTGTLVGFERDLGLEDSRNLQRFGVQWRPFHRQELAVSYFSAPRRGAQQINRDITFRDEVYPVNAFVTTQFDLDYSSLTYTYWARRTDRDGFGITLGVANLALDASVTAQQPPDLTVTITQEADTEVPVALAGVQGRVAFTNKILGEASVSTLPRVTIGDYSGRALTANAKLEYRPLRWLGIGASYDYFKLDVDVEQVDLGGSLDMTIRGPSAFVRLAF